MTLYSHKYTLLPRQDKINKLYTSIYGVPNKLLHPQEMINKINTSIEYYKYEVLLSPDTST